MDKLMAISLKGDNTAPQGNKPILESTENYKYVGKEWRTMYIARDVTVNVPLVVSSQNTRIATTDHWNARHPQGAQLPINVHAQNAGWEWAEAKAVRDGPIPAQMGCSL